MKTQQKIRWASKIILKEARLQCKIRQQKHCTKKKKYQYHQKNCGETVVLSANVVTGLATLVSREPGELATIYLQNELTVIGKMENAADAVIDLPTVSRIHAKIRKREGEYYYLQI